MFAAPQRRVPRWPLPPNSVVVREYVQGVLVAETLKDKAAPLPVSYASVHSHNVAR